MKQLIGQLLAEIARQDARHPGGYPPERNGIRAGIAALEDETGEALEAWHCEKKSPPDRLPEHQWMDTRSELIQVAAVALRAVRGLPRPCDCMETVGPGHENECPADECKFALQVVLDEADRD